MISAIGQLEMLVTNLGLLAQMSRWQRLGDGLRSSRSRIELADLLPYAIGAAVIGLGIWGAMQWIKRNDTSLPCDDPWKLFRELCHAHGLDGSSQRLLRKLAETRQLQQPAEVFLTPSVFDTSKLPPALQSQSQQLRNLRARLF